jgi:murein DD-endopeptidase / murein LD-carboxypeptidase
VPDDIGAHIAARAISRVGVPFRLHGRTAESGLDCVGLLADALASVGFKVDIPEDYGLRGRFDARARAFFQTESFKPAEGQVPSPGEVAIAVIGPRQLHFIIYVNRGFVHAHAGLRRVVLTPGPSLWPLLGRWNYIGE